MRCQTFSFSFFPCSADHERDWPPCKVVFFGLATNALNVRNNNNNNNCSTEPRHLLRQSIAGFRANLKSPEIDLLVDNLSFHYIIY